MNRELQMFKLDLEKADEPEIKLPASAGSWKKQYSSRKTSISALLTMSKPLTVWITRNCGKFFKRWEYHTTLPASWEICMHVKKQQLEPDIKLSTSVGSLKKQESSRKTSISALLTMSKPLTVWITINCGKFWERWTPDLPLEKSVCRSGSNS